MGRRVWDSVLGTWALVAILAAPEARAWEEDTSLSVADGSVVVRSRRPPPVRS